MLSPENERIRVEFERALPDARVWWDADNGMLVLEMPGNRQPLPRRLTWEGALQQIEMWRRDLIQDGKPIPSWERPTG